MRRITSKYLRVFVTERLLTLQGLFHEKQFVGTEKWLDRLRPFQTHSTLYEEKRQHFQVAFYSKIPVLFNVRKLAAWPRQQPGSPLSSIFCCTPRSSLLRLRPHSPLPARLALALGRGCGSCSQLRAAAADFSQKLVQAGNPRTARPAQHQCKSRSRDFRGKGQQQISYFQISSY